MQASSKLLRTRSAFCLFLLAPDFGPAFPLCIGDRFTCIRTQQALCRPCGGYLFLSFCSNTGVRDSQSPNASQICNRSIELLNQVPLRLARGLFSSHEYVLS